MGKIRTERGAWVRPKPKPNANPPPPQDPNKVLRPMLEFLSCRPVGTSAVDRSKIIKHQLQIQQAFDEAPPRMIEAAPKQGGRGHGNVAGKKSGAGREASHGGFADDSHWEEPGELDYGDYDEYPSQQHSGHHRQRQISYGDNSHSQRQGAARRHQDVHLSSVQAAASARRRIGARARGDGGTIASRQSHVSSSASRISRHWESATTALAI